MDLTSSHVQLMQNYIVNPNSEHAKISHDCLSSPSQCSLLSRLFCFYRTKRQKAKTNCLLTSKWLIEIKNIVEKIRLCGREIYIRLPY